MKLLWTEKARRDLLAIGRYIAQDNPRAARSWLERLRIHAKKAAMNPLAGRTVPEFSNTEIREVILRNYRIVYRVCDKAIHILTVFESHRLFLYDAISGSKTGK
jgi:addiction module RelE/StbE family toxin